MAKPDVFRMLGCIVMITLILVIAVKLSKQCMVHPPMVSTASKKSPTPSGTPIACAEGYKPNQNGFCMPA
jgi:hypothetical protein